MGAQRNQTSHTDRLHTASTPPDPGHGSCDDDSTNCMIHPSIQILLSPFAMPSLVLGGLPVAHGFRHRRALHWKTRSIRLVGQCLRPIASRSTGLIDAMPWMR